MLLSMTGYGDARRELDGTSVAVEIRAVNSRYLKINVRGAESAALEAKIEGIVRKRLNRGTVSVVLRLARKATVDDYRINLEVVDACQKQLASLSGEATIDLSTLLTLPGVVEAPSSSGGLTESDWTLIEPVVTEALESLEKMRAAEGQAMDDDFKVNCAAIATQLEAINDRAPLVVASYQTRLTERINTLLRDFDTSVTGADVAREVGVFAERSDISEEVVRLRSHLEQFAKISSEKQSAGRKLEFLIQEMFREINTIGSKSNDSEIAVNVVEIKTHVERMREMIQNVE